MPSGTKLGDFAPDLVLVKIDLNSYLNLFLCMSLQKRLTEVSAQLGTTPIPCDPSHCKSSSHARRTVWQQGEFLCHVQRRDSVR